MLIERRINPSTNRVELWEAEWEYAEGKPAKKTLLRRLGEEQPISPKSGNGWSQASAICWAPGRTLGNIAVFSETVLGRFPGDKGTDAILPCDFVSAGKFRIGIDRWWCRTHQTHWGTKADLRAASESGELRCSSYLQPMNYVLSPLELNLGDYAEVGIWCSLPAALSSAEIPMRPPEIHLHLREHAGDEIKKVDGDFGAISLVYHPELGLFSNEEITRINITPPAALEFILAIEDGRELDCINCSNCGFPHLDLGDFARQPHRKHFCGNCGSDSNWSKGPIVSTPLKPLHDQFGKSKYFGIPNRSISVDEYPGCAYEIWSSTPAVLWTADRVQDKGIHVHIERDGNRIVDETFGKVVLEGEVLDRRDLLQRMLAKCV